MSKRLRDWPVRLQKCIAERRALPFEWGEQDCGLFAADCVIACTGIDPAHDLRGKYSTAVGAVRSLARFGGIPGIAEKRFGPEINPRLAQPGDLGLTVNDGRHCLAVCLGSNWNAAGESGLVNVPLTSIDRAWRLPESN